MKGLRKRAQKLRTMQISLTKIKKLYVNASLNKIAIHEKIGKNFKIKFIF